MIDYIAISKYLSETDSFKDSCLECCAAYKHGDVKYQLNDCNKLSLFYSPNMNRVKLNGSIAYYYQGHNFTCDNYQFSDTIDYIGNLIGCDLWSADVDEFEYGVIFQVDMPPKEYIQHYRETKGLVMNEIPKDKGYFRFYEDANVSLKMYDAGRNIKHKCSKEVKQQIMQAGWNPDGYYLKWEVHYKRPHISLNNGVGLTLADLVNP